MVASSSRVRIPAPHKAAPKSGAKSRSHAQLNPWRIALKALTGGLWVVGGGALAVMTLLMGTGWLLAISTTARSAIQPTTVLAIPAGREDWLAPATTTIAEKSSIERTRAANASAAIADRFVFGASSLAANSPAKLQPKVKLAMAVAAAPELRDDPPVVTGSIPQQIAKAVEAKSVANAVPLVPLPRTKPKVETPKPDTKLASLGPAPGLVKPAEEPHPPRTAVYDITAKVVYLPNGERLEAHSGLGEHMDDPASSKLKMRGVTPPNTYVLTLREALFHGVQAIRMTPVDEGKMYGRDGILAHTYMLGPQGASNGCVSFRDYERFLRAFRRGEIERIVVVPRLVRPPTFASQSNTKA